MNIISAALPLCFCFLSSYLFAQSSYPDRAPGSPGSYRDTHFEKSSGLSSSENAKVSQTIDATVEVLKRAYPQPLGAESAPYGGFWQDYHGVFEIADGPYVLFLTIPFYELLNKRGGGIEPEETTLAFGLGMIFAETPKLMGHEETSLNPGGEINAKMQFFVTFDGNHIMDGGFLWESEIDVRGLGKPLEAKQNFTWAIVKGFSANGLLTDLIDKYYEVEPPKTDQQECEDL